MGSYNGFSAAQRDRAQAWLNEQARQGLLRWPTRCRACGQTDGIFDFHAEDYSEPFGPHLTEYPLCVVCHMVLHARFRNPGLWDRYRALVALGWRHEAVHRRAPVFGTDLRRYTRHAPPAELVLDGIGAPRPSRPPRSSA